MAPNQPDQLLPPHRETVMILWQSFGARVGAMGVGRQHHQQVGTVPPLSSAPQRGEDHAPTCSTQPVGGNSDATCIMSKCVPKGITTETLDTQCLLVSQNVKVKWSCAPPPPLDHQWL